MTARLLLIDDETRLTAMVGDSLRAAGFEVDAAPSLASSRENRLRGRASAESSDAPRRHWRAHAR
jgi:DNA-binding response OmpR family regulator